MKGRYFLLDLLDIKNYKFELYKSLLIINANCGSGKSYAMREILKRQTHYFKYAKTNKHKVYFLTDLTINKDQLVEEFTKMKNSYAIFDKNNKIIGYKDANMYHYIDDLILPNIMCYASFGKLKLENIENCIIIFDEIQNLFNYCWKYDRVKVEDNNILKFKKTGSYWNIIRNINTLVDNGNYCIGLSGTDEEIWNKPIVSYYEHIKNESLKMVKLFTPKEKSELYAYEEEFIYYYNTDYNVYKVLNKFMDIQKGDKALAYSKTIVSMENKKKLLQKLGYRCEFLCSINAYILELFEPTEIQQKAIECELMTYDEVLFQIFETEIPKMERKRTSMEKEEADKMLNILVEYSADKNKAFEMWLEYWKADGMKVAKQRMTKTQLEIREHILKNHTIPDDIDILLTNDAYITGFNLYDNLGVGETSPIKVVISNSGDFFTNKQFRNRNRNDLTYWFIKAPQYTAENGKYYLTETICEFNGYNYEWREIFKLDNEGNKIEVHDFIDIELIIDEKYLFKKLESQDKEDISYLYGRMPICKNKAPSFTQTLKQLPNYEIYKTTKDGSYLLPKFKDREVLIKAMLFCIKHKGKKLTDKQKIDLQNILGSKQLNKCNEKLKNIGLGRYTIIPKREDNKHKWIIK